MPTSIPQNPQYKDRLFKFIFGRNTEESKRWLLSLYNALNGSSYTDISDLKLTTIENIIYVTMKNDVSFLIGEEINLYEQQSTYNPNMPLRGLMYFAQLYQMILSERRKDLFGHSLVKIPSPRFVVFYNGTADKADTVKLRLSDAFESPSSSGEFEWTATMVNINAGHNSPLQKSCKALYDYSSYVAKVRTNLATMPKTQAVDKAVNDSIKENLLDGFFKRQKMEVLNMSLTEFDQEEYDRNRRQEGYEEGIADGISQGEIRGAQQTRIETARNLLNMNILTPKQISQASGLSIDEILALKNEAEPVTQAQE